MRIVTGTTSSFFFKSNNRQATKAWMTTVTSRRWEIESSEVKRVMSSTSGSHHFEETHFKRMMNLEVGANSHRDGRSGSLRSLMPET